VIAASGIAVIMFAIALPSFKKAIWQVEAD
jgi:hypothetical protein